MTIYWLKYRGTRFPVRRGETIVGRSPYCTIVLSNRLASRQHCAFRLSADGLSIIDLDSSNGTAVNGERIESERKLEPGDLVRVGTDLLEVVEGDSGVHRDRKITNPRDELADGGHALFEDTSTGIHESTLELVEALASSAAQTHSPTALAQPIQRAIDAIVERAARADEPLERVTAARLSAVIESVAAWYPARDLDSWRNAKLEAIREHTGA